MIFLIAIIFTILAAIFGLRAFFLVIWYLLPYQRLPYHRPVRTHPVFPVARDLVRVFLGFSLVALGLWARASGG